MSGLRFHMQSLLPDLLWQLGVVLIDTTASNSGTKILTGAGGSAAHLRSMIEEETRGDQELGHILIEARDCLSHAGRNEAEAGLRAFGLCKEGRTFMKTKQTIDESKGSKPRCWMKTLLDEQTQYVTDHADELLPFIEVEQKLKRGSLAKPPGGVKERFGFYGKSAEWYNFDSDRVELIVRFALNKEPRVKKLPPELQGISEADLTVEQRIQLFRNEGVRDMLLELANPSKRIALIIF
eukprot:1793715-Prymnesium_polylepis.1